MTPAEDSASDPVTPEERTPGVFVVRGLGIRIPPGGLQITQDANGRRTGTTVTLSLAVDVAPMWLDAACTHLIDASQANVSLGLAASQNNEQRIAEAMCADFLASMQAVVAAATAVDSLYAALKDLIEVDAATVQRWKERSTARYRQVAEILRRSFVVKDRNMVGVRHALKELYSYRDNCVHPGRTFHEPFGTR